MNLYASLVRKLLFRVDAERVHNMALSLISTGLLGAWKFRHRALEQELFGVKFPNPLGLAAGFDKNGTALGHWHHFGFGFVELGTVTALAQPGNPKPRLFRLPDDVALVNRMGFNNHGAEAVASRIRGIHSPIPVGINLGKSKITPLDEAPNDYRTSFRLLREFGAYFVINVSSPNTPGLRDLQERGPLEEIIAAIKQVDPLMPLFVKVAPDLEFSALDEVIDVAHTSNLAGLIATNTTISRDGLRSREVPEGGLSGLPLRDKAQSFMVHLRKSCNPEKVLIGVGGIMNGRDLYDRIAAGAHLCQTYTGWVYGGPNTAPKMLRGLMDHMRAEGVRSLSELRGSTQ
ncbi:MAG TPA: quinone-dependent dihydroorotate dehydrogenase [Fimbriimonadaceae bacterium]|nr:quinone-dependent dihydroorotate dehydrogenase [Fimbriimonadaceae bacterium]